MSLNPVSVKTESHRVPCIVGWVIVSHKLKWSNPTSIWHFQNFASATLVIYPLLCRALCTCQSARWYEWDSDQVWKSNKMCWERTVLWKKRTDTKELYLIFFDKIFEILEKKIRKKFENFRDMMKILKIGMFSLIFIEKTIVGLCLHNNYQSPYQLPSGPLILNSPTVDL